MTQILKERFQHAKDLRNRFTAAAPAELTAEQIEALEALGYLGH